MKQALRRVEVFAEHASGLRLRAYQSPVARAVVQSVLAREGLSFVVLFPRQSGKNELQAQIETYLLLLLSREPAEIVKVSPTWKPQSLNAMRRLERVLRRNLFTRDLWCKESGYIYRVDQARVFFLSGAVTANIVGATASALLEVDEAQDVSIAKFDKDIAPMAASTNATRVFWGTAWTSRTLLARELRAAGQAEAADGRRRVFRLTADDVAAEVAAYGQFVAGQVARLGRSNPMIRTQFYSEEIDAEGGMFGESRRAAMDGEAGDGKLRAGRIYALLVDVAGEDEGATAAAGEAAELVNPRRDSTAATVVEVDLVTLADPVLAAPSYRVVQRLVWVGEKHSRLYGQLRALAAEVWQVKHLVVDATGVGAGLASFLAAALGDRVIPFVFSSASKSKLGWDFLGVVDSGRFVDRSPAGPARDEFFRQLAFCQYEVLDGPGKLLRWGVPDGTRDPATGELVHDDLVLSAALVGVLDGLSWAVSGPALVVRAADPLAELDRGF